MTKSDQNIHQNAPNCTILKIFSGGHAPEPPKQIIIMPHLRATHPLHFFGTHAFNLSYIIVRWGIFPENILTQYGEKKI